MCCFSQPVKEVNATKIFARISESEQFLAYQMNLSAEEDLSMVLPLPIKKTDELQTSQPALNFINLANYSEFFTDLEFCFPEKPCQSQTAIASAGIIDRSILKVYSVGSFQASYVPTINDFSRLDPKFCMPETVWRKLPQYKNYGFAVFRLKKGDRKIHPIALKFITQDSNISFFPTLHIHNGSVEDWAEFDHSLYIQPHHELDSTWKKASIPVHKIMNTNNILKGDRTKGIISPTLPLYKKDIAGSHLNQDTLVSS